jgi:hypothetical protein
LYKDKIVARIEGRPEPSDLPVRDPPSVSDSMTPLQYESGSSAETPIEREARLKKEAQDRMRAKFGSGGLNGQAGGSQPWSNPGSTSVSSEDYFSQVTSAFSYLTSKTSEMAKPVVEKVYTTVTDPGLVDNIKSTSVSGWNTVVDTVTDPSLTENVKTSAAKGWSTVVTTVTDPNLTENVKSTAYSGWSWVSSTTGSLLTSAGILESNGSASGGGESDSHRRSFSMTDGISLTPVTSSTGAPSSGSFNMEESDFVSAPPIVFKSKSDFSLPSSSSIDPTSTGASYISPPKASNKPKGTTPVGDDFFASMGAK